jgi:hypothetical protein
MEYINTWLHSNIKSNDEKLLLIQMKHASTIAEANRPTVIRVSGDAAMQERLCVSQDVSFTLQIFFVRVERLHGKS